MKSRRNGRVAALSAATVVGLSASVAVAQGAGDASDFIEELYRLDEFLKQQTSIASQTRMSARESPGVITIPKPLQLQRLLGAVAGLIA